MTKKTYKSYSVYGTTIVLKNGARKPIQFKPFSFGGGVYYTQDEMVQEALEKDSAFGRKFYIAQTEELEIKAQEEQTKEVQGEKTSKYEDVTVYDISEAKEYLVEHFGIKRAALRSTVAIINQAHEHGINFVGI